MALSARAGVEDVLTAHTFIQSMWVRPPFHVTRSESATASDPASPDGVLRSRAEERGALR